MLAVCMCSYIYEGATNGSANIASPADRIARTHQPQKEILTLLDYRTRYNQYNTDVGEHPVSIASCLHAMPACDQRICLAPGKTPG